MKKIIVVKSSENCMLLSILIVLIEQCVSCNLNKQKKKDRLILTRPSEIKVYGNCWSCLVTGSESHRFTRRTPHVTRESPF